MPNLIEIGQTSLQKSAKKRYLFGPSRRFFVTDEQKRDCLSRSSQRARGATKKIHEFFSPISRIFQMHFRHIWSAIVTKQLPVGGLDESAQNLL